MPQALGIVDNYQHKRDDSNSASVQKVNTGRSYDFGATGFVQENRRSGANPQISHAGPIKNTGWTDGKRRTGEQDAYQNNYQHRPMMQTTQPNYSSTAAVNNDVINTKRHEIEERLLNDKPRSPMLLYSMDGSVFGVPVLNMTIDTALYISVAYTKVRIVFKNIAGSPINGIFVLPTEGTVTTVSAKIGDDKFVESSYISADDVAAEGFAEEQEEVTAADDPTARYMPGCFRLPLPEIPNNTAISITVEILEDLIFSDFQFHFRFPLTFVEGIAPPGIPLENWVSVNAKINCILPNIKYGSESWNLTLLQQEGNMTTLTAMAKQVRDFHLSYSTPSPEISSATLYAKPEMNNPGCFVTIVNPPSSSITPMPRDIIFLFDRSGSMTGAPWEKGVRAINTALSKMKNIDRFGIVCFDHEQMYFSAGSEQPMGHGMVGGLFQATRSNIHQAKQWIQIHQASGGTDIGTPLEWAIQVLQKNSQQRSRMQFVVLVTDGCVANEREIVSRTEQLTQDIRVLTFGIGRYCNWYFLKMLALKTRGWSSGAVIAEDIDARMNRMIDSANVPILRDVELDISNIDTAELYPPRIPDLFAGKPIIVAGVVTGTFPQSLQIGGTLTNGNKHILTVVTESAEISKGVPVRKIFIKQQIDQMVAEFWLNESQKVKNELVNLSIQENMPTPYSQMVAFEITPQQKQEFDNHKKRTGGKGWSGKKIAAVGAGVIVVGTGAFLLGNLVATASGAPSLLDGFGGGMFDSGGADCGECGECGDCCGGLEDCVGDMGEGIGDCFGEIGDAFGECCEAIGDCCGGIADGCEGGCEACGDCCDGCDDLDCDCD